MTATPYSITAIFDEHSLPDKVRHAHVTKDGVWGLLRVIEGEVTLVFPDLGRSEHATPARPALIPPQVRHHVELLGPMRLQIEFYRENPLPASA